MTEIVIVIAILAMFVGGLIWMLYFDLRRIKCYGCGKDFRAYKLESLGITEDACCYACKECMYRYYGR